LLETFMESDLAQFEMGRSALSGAGR